MQTRVCKLCKQEKSLEEYHRNRTNPLGRSYWCKDCFNAYARKRDTTPKYREKTKAFYRSEHGKSKTLARQRRDYRQNKHKYTAKRIVERAVKERLLEKKSCEICGSSVSMGHHPDYAKPLEVIWLCHKHHAEAHRQVASGD